MGAALKGIVAGAIGAGVLLLGVQTGVITFGWPDLGFDLPSLPRDVVVQERTLTAEEPAVVTRVEAVSLDCRARVHAEVAVTGERDHRVGSVVIRTDTVDVQAAGDVDTCVDADAVSIDHRDDGRVVVDVPGEAIRFVRPRVDMTSAATVVEHDKGLVGEITDLLPGGDRDDELVVGTLAYAQQVVGGQACMAEAFQVTRQALLDAYAEQLIAQGVDPSLLSVHVGEPDFAQHLPAEEAAELRFSVTGSGPSCTLAPDAHDGASPTFEQVG